MCFSDEITNVPTTGYSIRRPWTLKLVWCDGTLVRSTSGAGGRYSTATRQSVYGHEALVYGSFSLEVIV